MQSDLQNLLKFIIERLKDFWALADYSMCSNVVESCLVLMMMVLERVGL